MTALFSPLQRPGVAGVLLWLALLLTSTCIVQADSRVTLPATFEAHDTLHIDFEGSPAAQKVLHDVAWKPTAFEVHLEASDSHDYAAVVHFPSPRNTGDARLDRVTMLWYAARDRAGRVAVAPAVLLVHGLQPRMLLAKAMARGLAAKGFHAFVIELPGYVDRQPTHWRPWGVTMLLHAAQGVDDVRRARDAIAALPHIQPGPIALQGTSLGSFVATVSASLDGAFNPVFLMLAGADGYGVMESGSKDVALLRHSLAKAGYSGEKLKRLLGRVEPGAVASRLNANETWLFSARDDQMVRAKYADALANDIGLASDHHIWMASNHYTTTFLLPKLVARMMHIMRPPAPKLAHEGLGSRD